MPAMKTTVKTLGEVMTTDLACVHPADTMREAARVMADNDVSGVPVIDARNTVVGVLTRTDLLRRCQAGPHDTRRGTFLELVTEGLSRAGDEDPTAPGTVEEFMTTELITCSPDETLVDAARKMAEAGVHRVVVVSESREPLGIVSALDVLCHFPH